MDTQVKSTAFAERLWREWCEGLNRQAERRGLTLPESVAINSPRPPYYDYMLDKMLSQLTAISEELLPQPNGRELFRQRLEAMRAEIESAALDSLYDRRKQAKWTR